MHTSLKMKSEELSEDFLAGLKKLYAGKTIEIEISPVDFADDTECLMSTEANRRHLAAGLREREGRVFSAAEFQEFVSSKL